MSIRDEISRYQKRVADTEAIFADVYPMWVAWDLAIDLRATGAQLRAVNSQPPHVTFFITAERATEVLTWFSEDARVSAAEFAIPVADVRGREQFAIKVTIKESPEGYGQPAALTPARPAQSYAQPSEQSGVGSNGH